MNTTTTQATNNSAVSNGTVSNGTAITLTKVAADYKLQSSESFLTMGRVNKAAPNRPYYHVMMKAASANSFPDAPRTALPEMQLGIGKLWTAATLELLKEKAASLSAGASISINLTVADINTYILESGNRERQVISGEELDSFTSSYAFVALASVYNWNPAQVARVSVALRQYAAPAHRKPQADANILATRLEALPSLLTSDDLALDSDILRVYNWLTTKLQRDAAIADANLAESI